jgi:hypothetical protein
MSYLNFNPEWGRWEAKMLLSCWYIDQTHFSGKEEELRQLLKARQEETHREVDAAFVEIETKLKEEGMIK